MSIYSILYSKDCMFEYHPFVNKLDESIYQLESSGQTAILTQEA